MTIRLRCPDCGQRKDVSDSTAAPVSCDNCDADMELCHP